ncbi:MAG: outer membrane beta-barrel protein [Hyphomicrobium sp.]
MMATKPLISRLFGGLMRFRDRLMLAASACALGVVLTPTRLCALDLDLNGVQGLNTETVASRDRLKVWDNVEQYGASTVANTNRSEFAPEGVRVGNYFVLPTIGAAVIYDDNIFAIDDDKRSDIRTEVTPGIRFKSNLPRHVLDFSLDGRIVSYAENSDQDYANYRAKVEGALHFDHAHTLSLSVASVLKHEERDDPLFSLQADEPIPVLENRVSVGITRDVGRLYGTLGASYDYRNYYDVDALDGSTLDQDSRDTGTISSQLKIGYRFSPGFNVVGKFKTLRAENRGGPTGDRDSWGYEAVAGLAFETNPLLKWRILGGYGVRDFEDSGLDDLATSLINADVQWLPTQRLTVYASLYRQIEESLDLDATSVVQTGGKVRADYEIYHNLVLSGTLELRQDDFGGVDRSDDVVLGRVALDYYFSKNWLFTLGYEHQVRDSNVDSLDMHRNRYMVGAKLRF